MVAEFFLRIRSTENRFAEEGWVQASLAPVLVMSRYYSGENGAVEFLKRCVAIMLEAEYKIQELSVHVDSGHDST